MTRHWMWWASLGAALILGPLSSCSSEEPPAEPRVRLLLPREPGDLSTADAMVRGVHLARAGTGADFQVETYVPTDPDDAARTFDEWLRVANPQDLLVVPPELGAVVQERGCDLGVARVVLLAADGPRCRQLRSVAFDTFAAAYLAGIAAMESPAIAGEGRAGLLIGAPVPDVLAARDGFTAAVEARGGRVTRQEVIADDPALGFQDPERAAELAEAMLGEVDFVFLLAGASSPGAAAVFEERFPEAGVHVVGWDADFSDEYGRSTIASVVRPMDHAVRDAILEMAGGDLTPGRLAFGSPGGGTELPLSPRYAPLVVAGDCSGCDRYRPSCYAGCTTLEDAVRAATGEASAAVP